MTTDRAVEIELPQLRRLEIASFAEAMTLLLLLGIAVPPKHLGGWDTGGRVRGLAFVSYIWMAMQTVADDGWSRAEIVRSFIVAFLPFGGFFNLPFLFRKGLAQLSPWLKALHVACAIVFAGGVFAVFSFHGPMTALTGIYSARNCRACPSGAPAQGLQ